MACNVCPIGLKPYRWVRFEVKGDPIPLCHTHEKPHALALLPFGDQLLEALHWTLGFWWGEARDYFQRAVLMGKSWHITEPVVPLQGLGRSAGSSEKGEKDWEENKGVWPTAHPLTRWPREQKPSIPQREQLPVLPWAQSHSRSTLKHIALHLNEGR